MDLLPALSVYLVVRSTCLYSSLSVQCHVSNTCDEQNLVVEKMSALATDPKSALATAWNPAHMHTYGNLEGPAGCTTLDSVPGTFEEPQERARCKTGEGKSRLPMGMAQQWDPLESI